VTVPINPGAIGAEGDVIGNVLLGGKAVVGKATGVLGGDLGDVTDTVRAVRAWVSNRHNWVRVAWFLSGAAMFTVGVVMVGTRPLEPAVKAVAKVIP
jgi:hypothetical protein